MRGQRSSSLVVRRRAVHLRVYQEKSFLLKCGSQAVLSQVMRCVRTNVQGRRTSFLWMRRRSLHLRVAQGELILQQCGVWCAGPGVVPVDLRRVQRDHLDTGSGHIDRIHHGPARHPLHNLSYYNEDQYGRMSGRGSSFYMQRRRTLHLRVAQGELVLQQSGCRCDGP